MGSKIKEITEGWTNYILNRQNEVSALRMKICSGCEFDSNKIPDNVTKTRFDRHCTNCGCTLAAKTRSLDSECPIGLWKAVKIKGNENPKKKFRN